MTRKLLVNNFEWIKDTHQSNEAFIVNYNELSEERCSRSWRLEQLHECHNDLPFLPEEWKLNKSKRTKMCAIKRKIKFENYENCLEAT